MLVLQESTAERSTLIIQNVLIKFLTAGLIVLGARFILIRYCFYSNSAEDAQNKQKKKTLRAIIDVFCDTVFMSHF